MAAGSLQKAQLWQPSVKEQGICRQVEMKTWVDLARLLLRIRCWNLGSIQTMPSLPRGLWKA